MNNYTVKELKSICKKKNIKGYSKLNKKELINILKKRGGTLRNVKKGRFTVEEIDDKSVTFDDKLKVFKKNKNDILKKGRFTVEEIDNKSVTFDDKLKVFKIKKNDCPKENRVRQYTVYDDEGIKIKKTMCPPNKKSYNTKNGFECCKTVGGTKLLDIEKLNELTKDIELEEYEGFFDDDMGLELYDEMIENNKAFDICRGIVSKSYLQRAFEKEDVNGYIAIKNNKKIGFIIYYKKDNELFLDIVCTDKTKVKGIPLGQLLLYKMEEYAKKQKYKKMIAESVPSALNFYKKLGWKKIKKIEDKYLIEKNLEKKSILKKIKKIFK